MSNHSKLFAVYLGGRAPKANTELHDVVFVVGDRIESTYTRLKDLWFGSLNGLHIDSWIELRCIDGYSVSLSKQKQNSEKNLYFVNLGAYDPKQFTELHANAIVVASDEAEVKSRSKSKLLKGMDSVHKDDLFDIDDCLRLDEVDGYFVTLNYTGEVADFRPNNGYLLLPE